MAGCGDGKRGTVAHNDMPKFRMGRKGVKYTSIGRRMCHCTRIHVPISGRWLKVHGVEVVEESQ